jgi:hypothetical protein
LEALKLIWTKTNNYYNHASNLGTAQVEEILLDKWRWEAYSSNETQMFDMDCWWGTESSLEEAQSAAEQELLRWA